MVYSCKWGIRLDYDNKPSTLVKIHTADNLKDAYLISQNKDKSNRNYLKSCIPMDDDWKNRLENSEWSIHSKLNPEYLRTNFPTAALLQERLLSFAGEDTCLQLGKEGLKDIDRLLEDGQLWLGRNAKMMRGEPSKCHGNSAELYELNKDNFDIRICTGYALSKDGMWREHSWLIKHNPRSNEIIETTEPRICYYGWVLSEEECEEAVNEWIW